MADQQFTGYLGKYTLTVSPDFSIEDTLIRTGVWEADLLRSVSFLVQPGNCCVDVGANCGLITIALADIVGSTGCVHAFEPSSLVISRLMRNIEQNPMLRGRIHLHLCGLSNQAGTLKLFEAGDKPGNAYMAQNRKSEYWNRGGEHEYENCRTDTLDSIFAEQRVDFLKIDVEGMELEVLTGGIAIIKRDRPIIVYETLLRCFDNHKIEQCDLLLRSAGFLSFIMHPSEGLLVPTRYPNLAEDTVAIHRTKVNEFRHCMFNSELLDLAFAQD